MHTSPSATARPSRAALVTALVVALVAISSAALWIRMSRAAPVAIAFYRLLYATALLAPAALVRARGELARLSARQLAALGASGVVLALHFASWIASLAPSNPYATSVAASAVLVTLHPVLVALGTPLVLRGQRVPPRAFAGMLLALGGGGVIALADARAGQHRLVGDLLAFGGAVAAAAYFLFGARLRAGLSLLAYVAPVYAASTLALFVLARATGTSLAVTSLREHALFAALAVGPMVLGHTTLNWALGHLPAWVVSTAVLAEPVGSTLLVFVLLGEAPAPATIAGGALVLCGVAFAVAASARAGPAKEK